MKYSSANKRITEIVAEYIAKGYALNIGTMGWSQGEIASVDLTDGSEVIRVYAETFSDWKELTEGVEIVVGRAEGKVKTNESAGLGRTIWSDRLEIISRERITL